MRLLFATICFVFFVPLTVFVNAGGLPFKNPITKSMMQNNNGAAVREIMTTLEARGESGLVVKNMIFESLLVDLNPLQSAAKYEAAEVAKALLDHEAIVDSIDVRTESTPLIIAGREGSIKTAKVLLENGAEVNRKDKDGRTAVMLASIEGHKSTIELLVEHGANLSLTENRGNTALQIAAFYCGDSRLMSFMVENGAEINEVDNRLHSAIWLAASAGKERCVERLLALGADVTLVDEDGLDAAARATEKGHKAIALMIQEALKGTNTEL
jgi:ankyrin repeat protein